MSVISSELQKCSCEERNVKKYLEITIKSTLLAPALSLVGFNDAFNTIRLYERPVQGCVQTDVLSGNHKTKSAVLFRLLTQTKEAPKKRNRTVRVTNT